MRISDNRNVDICLLHAEEWCICSSSCDSGRKLNGTEFPTTASNWYDEIGANRGKIIYVTPSAHGGVVNEPL
jgi:hypothetical protein